MQTNYGLRLKLRIPQKLNLTLHVCLFVCGFHKLFWIPRIRLRIPQNASNFEWYSLLDIYLWNPKQKRRSNGITMFQFPQKSDFDLVRSPLSMRRMHILAW